MSLSWRLGDQVRPRLLGLGGGDRAQRALVMHLLVPVLGQAFPMLITFSLGQGRLRVRSKAVRVANYTN